MTHTESERQLLTLHDGDIEACVATETVEPEQVAPRSPTFILVHGLGVSSWYFEPLKDALCEHAPVVMLDLPGFGHSPSADEPFSVEELARTVTATIEELGLDDVVLVGHSMGSQVVTEALVQTPSLARAALLITPVVNPPDRQAWRVVWTFARSSLHETIRSIYRSVLTFITTSPAWIIPHFRAMVRYRMEERLGLVPPNIPIMIMGAANDRMCPRSWLVGLHKRAQEQRGEASTWVREILGASHAVIVSHVDEVLDACLQMGEIDR